MAHTLESAGNISLPISKWSESSEHQHRAYRGLVWIVSPTNHVVRIFCLVSLGELTYTFTWPC